MILSIAYYAIAGLLIILIFLLARTVIRKVKKGKWSLIVVLVVLSLIILLWVEMAVGIFGSPIAGN